MNTTKDIAVNSTIESLSALVSPDGNRRGGNFFSELRQDPSTFTSFITARTIPPDNKPFIISIYDTEQSIDTVSLIMMINPKDISIGQATVVNSEYSRVGWINTIWGNNQATISASGLTSGFYYVTNQGQGGLTNFYRKNSVGYLNVYALFSMFKNNGNYYMDGTDNPTLFKSDGVSRVINVMDTIKVSYDGSDYLGSFSSFSLSDVASNPFRMEYSFEFVVSSFDTDIGSVEGHVKSNNNDQSNRVVIAIQGMNSGFETSVKMNSQELNKYFPPDPPFNKYEGQNYSVPRTGVVDTDTKAQLRVDEGERLYVYRDSLGNLTAGVGHLVLPEDNLKLGDTITKEQSDAFFAKDYQTAVSDAQKVVPGFSSMPANVQSDMINMSFNLGATKFSAFKGTFACLNNQNYYGAAIHLRNTPWYSQTYPRSERIVQDILSTGKSSIADATQPGK